MSLFFMLPIGLASAAAAVLFLVAAVREPEQGGRECRIENARLVQREPGVGERTVDLADVVSIERWVNVRVERRRRERGNHTSGTSSWWLRLRDGRTLSLDAQTVGSLRRFTFAVRREAPHVVARTRRRIHDVSKKPASLREKTWRGHGPFWLRLLQNGRARQLLPCRRIRFAR